MMLIALICVHSFSVSFASHAVRVEPWRKRVIEDPEDFSDLEPDMYEKFLTQTVDDQLNEAWNPSTDGSGMWKEKTPHGEIQILEIITQGTMSVVGVMPDNSNLYIKYQANCDSTNQPHPLVKDFWYMNEANAAGLSPKALFLSPPSLLCERREGKCAFTISDEAFEKCKNQNATLRYMIMERAEGVSLFEFRKTFFSASKGAVGFRNSIVIGVLLIQMIERLHNEVGIVHGDIHAPNVMIETDFSSTGEPRLQLIDFGMAFKKSEFPRCESPIRPAGAFFHPLCTIWQMYGHEWSARDDILKAIQVIAQLMQPFEYLDFERKIVDSGWESLEKWKLDENWFVTDFFDPVQVMKDVSFTSKIELYALLDEIQATVRSLGINDPIPYELLTTKLLDCAFLATPKTPRSSPALI